MRSANPTYKVTDRQNSALGETPLGKTLNQRLRNSTLSLTSLRAGSAIGAVSLSILALPSAAYAQNECGLPSGGTVTCTDESNPYSTGIRYATADDLTIEVEDDVVVDASVGDAVQLLAAAPGAAAVVNVADGASLASFQDGISVISALPGGTATVDNGATISASRIGILAASDGEASITNRGDITLSGPSPQDIAAGIAAVSTAGDVTIINSGDIDVASSQTTALGLFGQSAGANVSNTISNSGAITIENTNPASASFGIALLEDDLGGSSISTISTNGSVSVNSAGVATGLLALGSGDVRIDASAPVSVSGTEAVGVLAVSQFGDVEVSVDDVAVTASAPASAGVLARADQGNVLIDAGGTVTVTGDNAPGIFARALGDVTLTGSGNVSTAGALSNAIDAQSSDGDVVLRAGNVRTDGDFSTAIRAAGTNTDVRFANLTTTGEGSDGLSAISTGGDVTVVGTNVSVSGPGSTAITASSDTGDVRVTTTGSVVASGSGGGGIFATSDTGDASVSANNVSTVAALSANAETGRAAVFASGANAAAVVTGTASTSGTGFNGADSATVTAEATGGNAQATVNNVSASGAGVNAVLVTATRDAAATLRGRVQATGAGADAVVVTGGDTATVTVGANGNVTATDGDGIVLTSANGSTLNNAGVIQENPNGFAVAAFGGPLTVNNSGTLTSDLRFTAGAEAVNNSGTFVIGPNPDFGAGTDVFNNAGTVRLRSGTTSAATATFAGLEAFNNAGGIIDLRNGVTGDTLTLPGTFTGTGASQLGLDVSLAGEGRADRLIIGGAATGSTDLLVSYNGPAVLNSGVVLVQGGAGTQSGAFVLADGNQNFGLIETGLVFNPANNSFALVGAPGAAVYRAASFVEGSRNLWHTSADAWSAHMRELRDGVWANGAGDSGGRLWAQMYGSLEERDNVATVNNLNRTYDLGYEQDYFGGQLGFDFGGAAGESGNFAFGVTGGYLNSRMNFNAVSDRVSFDAFNAGLYASFNAGGLFANALAKYDFYKADSRSQTGQYAADLKGDAYGAQAEIGFRLGSDSFYAEPVGTIAYVRSNLDDLVVQNSTIAFLDDDGLRGKLGARIGASFPTQSVGNVVLYAGGNYVHEFKGDDSIDFTNNGQTVRIDNRAIGDYGEAVIGVNVGSADGVSGFIEANGAKGSEFEAYGARAGLRVRF